MTAMDRPMAIQIVFGDVVFFVGDVYVSDTEHKVWFYTHICIEGRDGSVVVVVRAPE